MAMEAEALNQNKEILSKLDQDFMGVIWVTEGPLQERPKLFKDMDYLMDGVLTKFIHSESFTESQKNLFIGKSFGQPFYLIQLEANIQKLNEEAKNLVKISIKDSEKRKKLMILNNSSAKVDKELSKSFADYEFVNN